MMDYSRLTLGTHRPSYIAQVMTCSAKPRLTSYVECTGTSVRLVHQDTVAETLTPSLL